MKARILLALAIFIPFVYTFYYVHETAKDIVFRDDMYLIKGGFVESYCEGTMTFGDLWRSSASNRILGYSILQVANIKWFGMSSKLIAYLIPFLMLCSTLFIYRDYKKSLSPDRSPEFIAGSFCILTSTLFNVVQWEALTSAFAFVFQSPMPFLIMAFVSMEKLLSRGNLKYWPVVLFLSTLAILVFGGTQSFAFAPALGLTFLCYVLTHRDGLPAGFWARALLIGCFLAALAFLYLHRIHYNNYFPNSSFRNVDIVMSQPLNALQFVFAAYGASVVGVNAANAYFSFHTSVFLGILVIIFQMSALIFFFNTNMHHRTYMPFFLIMQVFFYIGFMTFGRFRFGIEYGMASRYTCVTIYGLVALAWILIFVLSRKMTSRSKWQVLLAFPLVSIFIGIFLTAIVEWRIQPHRKAYSIQLTEIAKRVDTATPEELSKFEERPYLVRESLRLLRDNELNVYRPKPKAIDLWPQQNKGEHK
jgi:hypothetical protein